MKSRPNSHCEQREHNAGAVVDGHPESHNVVVDDVDEPAGVAHKAQHQHAQTAVSAAAIAQHEPNLWKPGTGKANAQEYARKFSDHKIFHEAIIEARFGT